MARVVRKKKTTYKQSRSKSIDKALSLSGSDQEAEEEKVLNSEIDIHSFINAADAFMNIIKVLRVEDDFKEITIEKLKKMIQQIQKKISTLSDKSSNLETNNLGLSSKSLTTSLSSIASEISTGDKFDEGLFKTFMKEICCPFCSKFVPDNNSFFNHLNEGCFEDMKKDDNRLPYSVFQILANNTFKCNICNKICGANLQSYFCHINSDHHKLSYSKRDKSKPYTNSIFCSCCKILVANTFTQIEFHMQENPHKTRAEESLSVNQLMKEGVQCAFLKQGKFKCLVCSKCPVFLNIRELLTHFDLDIHRRNAQRKSKVYCECCSVKIDVVEVILHFKSEEHNRKKEDNKAECPFEQCFYCGITFDKLELLFLHMTFTCDTIKKLKLEMNTTKIKSTALKGVEGKEKLLSVQTSGKVKSTSTEVKTVKKESMVQQSTVASNHPPHVEQFWAPRGKTALKLPHIRNLFDRVLTHLKTVANQIDLDSERDIIRVIFPHLRIQNVGFRVSSLTFPTETLSMAITDSFIPNDADLLKSLYRDLLACGKFGGGKILFKKALSYIECVYKKKTVRIYFSQEVQLLSTMLRNHVSCKEIISSFCLLFKFWLALKEINMADIEFPLISLIIFFVRNINLVEHFETLNQVEKQISQQVIEKYPHVTLLIPKIPEKDLHVVDLFEEFLQFLNKFDFENYAICTRLLHPVPRSYFVGDECKPSDPVCILNLPSTYNLATIVTDEEWKKVFKAVEDSARSNETFSLIDRIIRF